MTTQSKAPFGVAIEAKLKPGATLSAKHSLGKLMNSYKKASKTPTHWLYTTSTGVGESIFVFAPFQKYADLDRPTTGDLAAKADPGANIDSLITTVDESFASIKRSIVEYVPSLSNPPTHDAAHPGPYLYHVRLKLKSGSTLQARNLASTIAKAYTSNKNAPKYWGYTTPTGESDVFHVFIPFKNYAELDSWPSTSELLVSAKADADSVLTSLDGLIEVSERTVLSYVDTLSHAA